MTDQQQELSDDIAALLQSGITAYGIALALRLPKDEVEQYICIIQSANMAPSTDRRNRRDSRGVIPT